VTKIDFILGIVGSLIAAYAKDFGCKGLVYIRSKKFRKARRRFIRTAPAQLSFALAPVYGFAGRHLFTVAVLVYASLVAVFINFNTLDVQALNAAPTSDYFFLNDILPFPL
jgi:hypothetical protein